MLRPYHLDSKYLVSDKGFVVSLKYNKRRSLSRQIDSLGYYRVIICINGKPRTKRIHTMVLETFVGPRPDELECRHLDGNSLNNNLSNLKWGTRKENSEDTQKHNGPRIGSNNPSVKLTDEMVIEIKQLLESGKKQAELAAKYGVTISTISSINLKTSWRHIE